MGVFRSRKRPFYWRPLIFGAAWLILGILQYTAAEPPEIGIAYMLLALGNVVVAFYGKPEEPPVDTRPMEEKLREAFAGLTREELRAIIDDDLRSEETKAIAGKILKERKVER